jgi:hypothetical protein
MHFPDDRNYLPDRLSLAEDDLGDADAAGTVAVDTGEFPDAECCRWSASPSPGPDRCHGMYHRLRNLTSSARCGSVAQTNVASEKGRSGPSRGARRRGREPSRQVTR